MSTFFLDFFQVIGGLFMTLKERIKKLANSEGLSIPKLEDELGFGGGTISRWDKSAPSADKLAKIADRYNVTVNYLLYGGERICPECGFHFFLDDTDDMKAHMKEHSLWQKASEKFGKLYCNSIENEKIKSKYRGIRNNLDNPLQIRYDAELKVLRCLFSRSIMANGFDLRHKTFREYVAMMLHTSHYQNLLDTELRNKLIKEYGTLPGINNGESCYYIPSEEPETIAAHKDEGYFTPDELNKIEEYKKLLIAARPKG